MKATSAQSLRSQVEKWPAPRFPRSVRVTVFSRTGPYNRRYVRVESPESVGSHALFFFLRDEGCWSVIPPETDYPRMKAVNFAA